MTVVLHAAATAAAPALLLRPWREEDLPDLLEIHRDPLVRRWQIGPPLLTRDDAARWLREQRRGWETGERFSFAVTESVTGSMTESMTEAGADAARPVGGVGVKEYAPGRGFAEVGYLTAPRARGRGVAPRALEAVTAWAFEVFAADGLERLELFHAVPNTASCRVAEKAGYRFERVLPAVPPYPTEGHLHVRPAPAPVPVTGPPVP
ncbi:GNAT family N-acetyltransferase [Streptomyces sp. NPDC059637]|uniref:GNAT family N-acetyltransferase n=1 Tax=Streptomyces sp. NPDC059637 TaxID=3347752 RepID=UPI0036919054